jgi:hypothetical protein
MKNKILLMLLTILLLTTFVSAELDCPFGEVNSEYPGKCGQYTDENKDSICDHSQEVEDIELTTNSKTGGSSKNKKPIYDLLPIILISTALYLIGLFLVKKKKISTLNHRRFWNILLLISFLGSCLLGLLLVIRINTGFVLSLPFNMMYWHVELGIVMTIISIFHIIWHWKYFVVMFKK